MKRRPTSKIWLTVMYMRDVQGMTTFTARDIHNAMPDARVYYHSLIPNHVLAKRVAIFEHHGYPGVEYDYTVTEYLSLYPYTYRVDGYPVANVVDLSALNRDLANLFRPFTTIDNPYHSPNLTHDQVCNAYRRGYLLRDETQHPFVYRPNPDYLED